MRWEVGADSYVVDMKSEKFIIKVVVTVIYLKAIVLFSRDKGISRGIPP
jgi:hypothetical protein